MKIEKFSSNPTTDYSVAVNTIKEAILRSQYQAKDRRQRLRGIRNV